jgi:hypothetical protein
MPARILSGDWKLILPALVLLAVLFGLMARYMPREQGMPGFFTTSYSSAGEGALAAYLLLDELGYEVSRSTEPLSSLPTEPDEVRRTFLVVTGPSVAVPRTEGLALRAFLRAGGNVLFAGYGAAELLPEVRLQMTGELGNEWKAVRPQAVSPVTRGVAEIEMPVLQYWRGQNPNQVALFGDDSGSVVVSYPHGGGTVHWWAATTPLTNAGIRRRDNIRLLLNTLGPPGRYRIVWDEYLHGRGGSLWTYLGRTPAPWLALQLGLLLAAVLWTFSRRHGPVREPAAESRLSPLEFVETLGDLYHRAGAANLAVESALRRFRQLLAARLALPQSSSLEALSRGARERLVWREPGLYETLQRAEHLRRDPELDAREALRTVQALDHYLELLRLKPGGAVRPPAAKPEPPARETR